jgi:enamine deaminase RidA (YjgF/YER057c/UK114 family)
MTGGEANLRFSNPPELATPPGYTHVVEATGGRTIYVAGQVARNRSGDVVGTGDMAAQTRQVFENLKVALESVGAGFGDVVKLNYYLTDISQIGVVREVRDEYLDAQRPPASTVVEVPRLVQEEFLIEVEAVARS